MQRPDGHKFCVSKRLDLRSGGGPLRVSISMTVPFQTFEEYYHGTDLLEGIRRSRHARRPMPKPKKRKAKRKTLHKKAARPFGKPKWWPAADWTAIHYTPRLGGAGQSLRSPPKMSPVSPNPKMGVAQGANPRLSSRPNDQSINGSV